jgi:carbon starvation protein CstA
MEIVPSTYQDWTWVKWHFYMCLSSIYVGMLITNWGSANLTTNTLQPSSFGFWVRIGMAWAATVLYIWTLIAPKVFPQRDFVVE